MIRFAPVGEMRVRGAALIAAAAAETGTAGDVHWHAIDALDRAGLLLLVVVEVDGQLVGHCCAAVGPEFWSPTRSVTTLSVFVQPAHRGRWGLPLLRRLMVEAAALGCVLRVQALPGSRLERLMVRLQATRMAVTWQLPAPETR